LEVLFCQCVKHSLRFGQDLLIQLQFHFWKQEDVTGCQIRGARWVGDDSHFEFLQKPLGKDGSVRRGVVMVKQPGPFSPKFGAMSSHDSTQSPQNVAVETRIHILACWEKFFVLPQLLYRWRHQSGLWLPPRISTHSRCSFPFMLYSQTFRSQSYYLSRKPGVPPNSTSQ
jgi:hypothetical protein